MHTIKSFSLYFLAKRKTTHSVYAFSSQMISQHIIYGHFYSMDVRLHFSINFHMDTFLSLSPFSTFKLLVGANDRENRKITEIYWPLKKENNS